MTLTKQWYQILSQYENECSFILFPRVAPHRLECILNHYIAQRTNCDAVDRNVVPQKSVNSQTNYTYIHTTTAIFLLSRCLPQHSISLAVSTPSALAANDDSFSLLINLPSYSLHGVIWALRAANTKIVVQKIDGDAMNRDVVHQREKEGRV